MYGELHRMIFAHARRRRWTEATTEDILQETFCRLAEFMQRRSFDRQTWRWGYRNALLAATIHTMNLHENRAIPGPHHQVTEIPIGLACA
jgi:hypothetical protein